MIIGEVPRIVSERCGKLFYADRYSLKKGYAKFCSRKCYDRGISNLHQLIRGLPEMQEWQHLILMKDEYTCQSCGQGAGVSLHAHHIIRSTEIISSYGIETLEDAKNCSLLWSLDNGITLCELCHKHVT